MSLPQEDIYALLRRILAIIKPFFVYITGSPRWRPPLSLSPGERLVDFALISPSWHPGEVSHWHSINHKYPNDR